VFRLSLAEVWKQTAQFYVEVLKDEAKISQAEKDPKLKMSLVFRWYLGQSSSWANSGVKDRAMDYQVGCSTSSYFVGVIFGFCKDFVLDRIYIILVEISLL
jgi:hypothetical protein